MSQMKFNAGIYNNEFDGIFNTLYTALETNGQQSAAEKLKRQVQTNRQNTAIHIAFVGQYSAGKSSIISAITGNRAIAIGSDVTTDTCENYQWGDFMLTDTPGLQNNQTHDDWANEAIKQSDLIVYCITSELFGQCTLSDFKRLAFEKRYKGKMVLVVNKINSEYTLDIDALLHTYYDQLKKDMAPYDLEDIPVCFIDVKDYLDGINEKDEDLIRDSRFDQFITFLNKFLNEKGLLFKMTTPILTAKAIIDNVLVDTAPTDEEKNQHIALSRLTRTVDQKRTKTSRDWDSKVSTHIYAYIHDGYGCVNRLGEQNFDFGLELQKITNTSSEDIGKDLDILIDDSIKDLSNELSDILKSKMGQFLLQSLSASESGLSNVEEKCNGTAGGKILEGLGKGAGQIAAKLTPDKLYNIVKNVGHEVLHIKFKPWGITKAAAALSKAASAIGPAVAIIGLAVEVKEMIDEDKEARQLMELKKEAKAEVRSNADELRRWFDTQKGSFLEQIFDPLLLELESMQEDITSQSSENDSFRKALLRIKGQLDVLLSNVMYMGNT